MSDKLDKAENRLINAIVVGALFGAVIGIIAGRGAIADMVIGMFTFAVIFFFVRKLFLPKEEKQAVNDFNDIMEQAKYIPNITCPTCNNATVEKISTGRKAGYVAVTGILAPAFKTVRSQFECKTCGYKW